MVLLVFAHSFKQPTTVHMFLRFPLHNQAGNSLFHIFTSRKTDIPGNYLRQDHLNWITNQFAQPRHFLYQSAVQFVLAPTTFCIRPTALVKTAQMNLTLSFSWLEPSIQSSQLRCVLERNVIASVV